MYIALGGGARSARVPLATPVTVATVLDAGVVPRGGRHHVGHGHSPADDSVIPSGGTEGDGETDETDETSAAPPPLTAADKRVEWRGDTVALPTHRLDMAGGDDARALNPSEISTAISNGSSAVIACLQKAATNTGMNATVTLQMVVDGSGKVTSLRVEAPHILQEHGLLACARGAAAKLPFASTGAPTLVTAPFDIH